jgi:hypothetical protein
MGTITMVTGKSLGMTCVLFKQPATLDMGIGWQ